MSKRIIHKNGFIEYVRTDEEKLLIKNTQELEKQVKLNKELTKRVEVLEQMVSKLVGENNG